MATVMYTMNIVGLAAWVLGKTLVLDTISVYKHEPADLYGINRDKPWVSNTLYTNSED